jgi:hypothetical protein
MTETTRGILTEQQREFLRMDEDERKEQYSRQERYRKRKLIRERLANGLFDLRLLFYNAPEKLLDEVFGDGPEGEAGSNAWSEVSEEIGSVDIHPDLYIPGSIGFLIRATDRADLPLYPDEPQQPLFADFSRDTEKAVERFLARQKDTIADASVSITINDIRATKEVIKRLRMSDTDVGLDKLAQLEAAGVDREELIDLVDDPD